MLTAAIERLEERLERAAGQILEDEELPIFHLLNVEQGGNVRVVENGERHRLFHEAPAGIAGERQTGGEKLQGNQAVQFEVERLIDLTHPTRSEKLFHLVMKDSLANHGFTSVALGRPKGGDRGARELAPDADAFQATAGSANRACCPP